MKKKLVFLMIALIVASMLLCSCSSDKDNGKNNDDTQPSFETVDPLQAIDLKDYVMIRSDSSSKEIKDAAVDLRMAIQKKCGFLPDLKTDFSGKGDLEIVIGKTKRGGADGLNQSEYIIKHTENAPPKVIIAEGASRNALILATPSSPKQMEIITKTIATTRPIMEAISKIIHLPIPVF